MGFLDWYDREKKLTDYSAADLRRQEERLAIRENQALGRLERVEDDMSSIFTQGADSDSPVRRRLLARLFEERTREAGRLETELSGLVKEGLAVAAIRFRLERRAEGEEKVLKGVGGKQVDGLVEPFEDPEVDDAAFAGALAEVLGPVADPEGDPLDGLGETASRVLEAWERMDRGEPVDLDEPDGGSEEE